MPEDLKEYVNQHGFEEFCLKHTFDKMLFDNFYNAIIRSDAEVEFKRMPNKTSTKPI